MPSLFGGSTNKSDRSSQRRQYCSSAMRHAFAKLQSETFRFVADVERQNVVKARLAVGAGNRKAIVPTTILPVQSPKSAVPRFDFDALHRVEPVDTRHERDTSLTATLPGADVNVGEGDTGTGHDSIQMSPFPSRRAGRVPQIEHSLASFSTI